MKPYSYYCGQASYDRSAYKNAPELVNEYFVYSKGIATKVSCEEYNKYNGAKERVQTPESVKAKSDFWDEQRRLELLAQELWYDDLKEEYGYLRTTVFDLCYSKAYEDGHAGGCDEIANYMIDIVSFAEKIMKAA